MDKRNVSVYETNMAFLKLFGLEKERDIYAITLRCDAEGLPKLTVERHIVNETAAEIVQKIETFKVRIEPNETDRKRENESVDAGRNPSTPGGSEDNASRAFDERLRYDKAPD